ncbi:MAG: glycoside hydrolase family 10 protein [Gemmatimonadota bacterium]
MNKFPICAALLLAACAPGLRRSELSPPPVAREFRGVWVASVSNIDWPSKPALPSAVQQAELIAILDKVRELRMNAVILQVRPAGDALYASQLEPWSEYLTGEMGKPPEPYYDPLEFAVSEAHKRGLELHAWFNPYRARHPSAQSEIAPTHLSRTRPGIVHPYGRHLWMDPGEPDVQTHSLNVILDVVKRYDIDGVHIDDYFYPYQERDSENRIIPFPDDASWTRYVDGGGTLSRDDWRRSNVDGFIERVYRGVKQTRPWVKFGISPFGIWRPGYPPSVRGFDAYANLYADARKWLNNGWLDYWTPQLYYNAPQQNYSELLAWWIGENLQRRHVWPGNAPARVGRAPQNWPPTEIVEQIRVTRAQPGATGNIHFSMRTLMRNQGGVSAAIAGHAYTYFALPPRTPWLDDTAPAAPQLSFDAARHRVVISQAPGEAPAWFAVRLRLEGKWYAEVISAQQAEYDVLRQPGNLADVVVITAVDRSGNESRPATLRIQSASASAPASATSGSRP